MREEELTTLNDKNELITTKVRLMEGATDKLRRLVEEEKVFADMMKTNKKIVDKELAMLEQKFSKLSTSHVDIVDEKVETINNLTNDNNALLQTIYQLQEQEKNLQETLAKHSDTLQSKVFKNVILKDLRLS